MYGEQRDNGSMSEIRRNENWMIGNAWKDALCTCNVQYRQKSSMGVVHVKCIKKHQEIWRGQG